jgi:hypothetical protein
MTIPKKHESKFSKRVLKIKVKIKPDEKSLRKYILASISGN